MKKLLSVLKCPSKYHHGNVAADALVAASALLQAKGIDSLSLRGVARAIGVSPCALYRHYKDKQALLEALAEHQLRNMASYFHEYIEKAPSDEPLLALGKAYLSYAKEFPHDFKLVFNMCDLDPLNPQQDGPYAILLAIIEQMHPPGTPAQTIQLCALSAWSTVHGMAELNAPDVAQNAFANQQEELLILFVQNLKRGISK